MIDWCNGDCNLMGPHWRVREGQWLTNCAVVTGGSGRVGPMWIDELEKMGYRVFNFDLPEYDITNIVDIADFKASLMHNGYAPSVLVNNAAIDNPPGSGASFFGNMDKILEVNLIGLANMTKAFIPVMAKRGGGVIVNIGSIMGETAADYRRYEDNFEKPVAYNISKAALIQFSRSIAVQYGRDNIRAVTLAFGPLDTPDLPEDFRKKFIADVPLQRLISEKSWRAALRFAIECPELSGTRIMVDGGYCAW